MLLLIFSNQASLYDLDSIKNESTLKLYQMYS